MHEFSIVQSLLDIIQEQAKAHGAKRVHKVELLVGVLSGVEPHLLQLAFETFKEGTIAESAQMVIHQEKLSVYCFDCEREYEKEELNAQCPQCGSLNTRMVKGQELLLKSLELEV